MEVLNGGHGGSARTAADHCVLPFHSHVQYYIDKWRDSEVAELVALTPAPVASQARTMAESPSPVSQIPVPSPTLESLLPSMPDHVRANSKSSGKTWVAKQAGLLVQRGECSIRAQSALQPGSVAELSKLTIPKLQGLLLRDDGQRWADHAKLKSKKELVAACICLYGFPQLVVPAPLAGSAPPPVLMALPPPQQ